MATTKKQTEIQSATIARGTDRVTHQVFYVVQSDTDPNTWYQVTWNNERLQWCCNCPARCDGCKHQRATLEVIRIRRATIDVAMSGQRRERPISQKGNLNGGGREFSLLR